MLLNRLLRRIPSYSASAFALGLGLLTAGCISPISPESVTAAFATAGCEAPTEELLIPQALMLPGRACLNCHKKGGQASDVQWTLAGTVFDSKNAPCNTNGVEGVKVEVLDMSNRNLITLFTNRTGNFFTSEPIDLAQFQVRISKDNRTQQMVISDNGNPGCASCHQPPQQPPTNPPQSPDGRIYL